MRIAELSADHRYAALYHPEAFVGNNDPSPTQLRLFDYDTRVGDLWAPHDVGYHEETGGEDDVGCSRLGNSVRPPETARPVGDFPHYWGINHGVLTERSFSALHDLMSPYVEFLPLLGTTETFTAFKVLRFVDALDREHSLIQWYPQVKRDLDKPKIARQVRKYVFKEERLTNEVIFRLPEMPLSAPIFVTEVFIDAVNAHSLCGFSFTQVWPPIDEREKFRAKRKRKRRKQ